MREIRPKIGKYEVKAMLGEGATGVVYEGYDPDIERRVAIKTLHPYLLTSKVGAGLLARFKREAISAARCIHPNIVTVLEYGQHEGRPFIVMEYVDGISVHRFIKQRRRQGRGISLRRSLDITSGLLSALHVAHWYGIVHRDVKASNVLITNGSRRIKLADFGMARITENSDLTMIGSLIGTPRYMAPEVRFGLEADPRADVFSAARLLLELLTMLPDSTKYPRSRLPEIADMPPGNQIDYSVAYPSAFVPVLVKGLDPDRTKRHQSVAEFMQAIKKALPDLQRQQATTVSARAAPVARQSHDDIAASDDELDSMTSLLAVFVGPIASTIMEEHEARSTSADNLALGIAREIPGPGKQQEFLRRWQTLSISRRAAIEENEAQILSHKDRSHPLPGEVLNRIGNKFAHYIEPISKTLLRHTSNKTAK
ncbi:MAG: serine/threonine protein kinase, partial [Gammaproteobacteria bacterium]|nr:serine/threonine protein kinase [Gammaproteobacteria bacterium]